MLIYYSFEARMYSLLAFLATASMYCLFTKKWKSHILFTSLGLWTQPFMALVIFSQIVYLFLCKRFNRSSFFSFLFSFLIFLPWLPTLFSQFFHSSSSWIWPISTSTLTTILGSLFTGHEGTPGNLWNLMGIISIMILVSSFWLIQNRILKQVQNDKIINFIKLLLCWLFLPVILVLTVSILKPIYVNRYLIFVTVAEVFLIIAALSLIKNSSVRFLLFSFYFLLSTYFLFLSASFHQKQDIRQTLNEINYLAKPTDLILAQTPLTIFETHYYARDPGRVFLYNPKRTKIPDYVGKNLINKMKQTDSFPFYPQRAFLIHDDASYEMVYQR